MTRDCEWTDGPGPVHCKVCDPEGKHPRPFPRRRNCPAKRGMPPIGRRAWNLSAAVAAFVADGLKTVEPHEYRRRLSICDCCPGGYRRDNWCAHRGCGCYLPAKAAGCAWRCPAGHWNAES